MVRPFTKIVAAVAAAMVEVTTTSRIKEECNQICQVVLMEEDVEAPCFKATTITTLTEISKATIKRTITRQSNVNSLKAVEIVHMEISVPLPMDLVSCKLGLLKCPMETMDNKKWKGLPV